jgi:hypothetical protein
MFVARRRSGASLSDGDDDANQGDHDREEACEHREKHLVESETGDDG